MLPRGCFFTRIKVNNINVLASHGEVYDQNQELIFRKEQLPHLVHSRPFSPTIFILDT